MGTPEPQALNADVVGARGRAKTASDCGPRDAPWWPSLNDARGRAFWIGLGVAAALVWLFSSPLWNRQWFLAINALAPLAPLPWQVLTQLGDSLAALTLLLPVLAWRPQLAWAGINAAWITTLLTHALKAALDVSRPPAVLDVDRVNVLGEPLLAGSLPSGHTATAFVFAGILVLSGAVRGRWARVALALAILIGLSRLAVSAHWPQDVALGAACGWLGAWLGLALGARWRLGHGPRAELWMAGFLALCAYGFASHQTDYPAVAGIQPVLSLLAIGSALIIWPWARSYRAIT